MRFQRKKCCHEGFFILGLKTFLCFFVRDFPLIIVDFYFFRSKSASNFIRSFFFSGTCCSYRPHVTAIDDRGNTRATTLDFSGGVFFNTTVDNFDHLVKSSEMVRKKDFLSFVAFIVCCFCEIGDLRVEKWNICWLI